VSLGSVSVVIDAVVVIGSVVDAVVEAVVDSVVDAVVDSVVDAVVVGSSVSAVSAEPTDSPSSCAGQPVRSAATTLEHQIQPIGLCIRPA